MIPYACPQCREPLQASEDRAGMTHPCPNCQFLVQVPSPRTSNFTVAIIVIAVVAGLAVLSCPFIMLVGSLTAIQVLGRNANSAFGTVGASIGTLAANNEDLDARREIAELHKAVSAFGNDPRLGAVGFLPSSFDPSGNDPASASYISRLFPHTAGKLNCGGGRMEGHQCLVFFLRGPKGQGWSTNPRDPCAAGGERIGPFFDFKPDRLTGNPPACLDRFRGQPIAYFCATGWNGKAWVPDQYNADDCASLGVRPYAGMNPDSFQLICAGRNKKFGTAGAQWNPANAMQIYPPGSDGHDDITNFSTTLLGDRNQ
jgi:hypothetical protein